MKESLYKSVQSFSRVIIRPVMFMAVTGLLVSIFAILKLEFMPEILRKTGTYLFNIISAGNFSQLSVIFCVGITTAFAKKKQNDAAIIGISSFLIFLYANNFWLEVTGRIAEAGSQGLYGTGQGTVLGVQVTDMGVFLGIFLGCVNGYLFNKFCDVKFHKYLSPYEGTKFAYFVIIFVTILLSILLSYIWPVINIGVNHLVALIGSTGSFGFFIYGFANRLLLPFGLHHLLWMPLFYTPLGGTATVAGENVVGAYNIWLSEIANISNITSLHPSVGYLVNFGCTAIPLGIIMAFIKTAKPENKTTVKATLIPLFSTAALAGITEPIEFLFLFLSPVLWVAHAIIYGLGLLLASVLNIHIPIDSIITAITNIIIVPNKLGNQWLIPIVFIIIMLLEYFVFKTLIEKFNIPTIGRTNMVVEENTVKVSEENLSNNSTNIPSQSDDYILLVSGLGGVENISEINNCYTRLRIDLKDDQKINEGLLNQFPSMGVIKKKNHIQIIVGTDVETIKEGLIEFIDENNNG